MRNVSRLAEKKKQKFLFQKGSFSKERLGQVRRIEPRDGHEFLNSSALMALAGTWDGGKKKKKKSVF